MPHSIKVIVLGMLYGTSLMAGFSNTLMIVLSILNGAPDLSPLATAITGWALILYIHYRLRLPPFHRSTPGSP